MGGDYTMEDALMEIGTSAVFGGLIRAALALSAMPSPHLPIGPPASGSARSSARNRRNGAKVEMEDKAARAAPEPAKAVELDADVVRAADDAEAVVRIEEPAATPERVSEAVREAIGDRPILRAAGRGPIRSPFLVARAIQDSQEAVAADPAGIMPLVKVFDATPTTGRKACRSPRASNRAHFRKMGPTQIEAARLASEIYDQPERMQVCLIPVEAFARSGIGRSLSRKQSPRHPFSMALRRSSALHPRRPARMPTPWRDAGRNRHKDQPRARDRC